MKKIILPILITSLTIFSCKNEESKAVETPVEENTTIEEEVVEVPDSAAIADAWASYMTPSKTHEMLTKDSGKWTSDLTFWMDGQEQKSTAEVEYKMILGGRYQESVHTGDMWGMPFEGRGLIAFDNATEEFISTWIDNMGTGLMVTRGKYDEASKTLTLNGTMVDPVSKKEEKVKEVLTYIDDNNQKMEMYKIDDKGKETKTMEIISKRK